MNTQSYSIRARLVTLISLPLILAALIIGAVSLASTYEEIEEVYDAQLAHSAKVLLQLTEKEDDLHKFQLGAERAELAHRYENKLTFRIWKGGRPVIQSHQAEAFGDFRAPPGFSDQTIAEERWRFFVFIDEKNGFNVEIGERYEVRIELIYKILLGLFIPLSLFIPLLLFIVWYGVTRCLKPVVSLSQTVDRRDADDFTAIEAEGVPQEIHPLIKAINRLLSRIQDSFERERQFTDNAAHELRTPLAAMKTQTQVLLKKADAMPDCREGLDNLQASIDRAAHMVDQLLSFSRLQADRIEFERLDLSGLTSEILQEISPLAVKKLVDLEAEIEPEAYVRGNRNALALMIRNLLDNAIKFTPAQGRIEVSVRTRLDKITLSIKDTGPGIPEADREKVFERFYRIQKNTHGSGLGLSMAKWVCDIHGANVSLESNSPCGLVAVVTMEKSA